jgi:hypothetical protein
VAAGKCTQSGPNPFVAGYRITNALDATEVLASGTAMQGDEITFSAVGTCIPDTLAVTISIPTGAVTQSFTVDSSCDGGRGLILLEDYGAFESYGYSCSATDTHMCSVEVAYGLKVCNTGIDAQNVYEFFLKETESISGEEVICDLIEQADPADLALDPDECYYETKTAILNRCAESNYCVDVSANATNPITGIPKNCPGADQMKFGWPGPPEVPPTPFPRYVFQLMSVVEAQKNLVTHIICSLQLVVLRRVPLLRQLLHLLVLLTLNSLAVLSTIFPLIITVKAAHRLSLSDTSVMTALNLITFSLVKSSHVKIATEVLL